MNKILPRIFIGAGILIVLLALLSLTVLNDQFGPTRKAAFMRAGRLAAEERDYDAAIEYYQMAIGLDRYNADAYLRLSEVCVYNMDVESALYYLDKGYEMTSSERLRDTREELLASINAQENGSGDNQANEPDPSAEPSPPPASEPPAPPSDVPTTPEVSTDPVSSPSPDASAEPDASPDPSMFPSPDGIV